MQKLIFYCHNLKLTSTGIIGPNTYFNTCSQDPQRMYRIYKKADEKTKIKCFVG